MWQYWKHLPNLLSIQSIITKWLQIIDHFACSAKNKQVGFRAQCCFLSTDASLQHLPQAAIATNMMQYLNALFRWGCCPQPSSYNLIPPYQFQCARDGELLEDFASLVSQYILENQKWVKLLLQYEKYKIEITACLLVCLLICLFISLHASLFVCLYVCLSILDQKLI